MVNMGAVPVVVTGVGCPPPVMVNVGEHCLASDLVTDSDIMVAYILMTIQWNWFCIITEQTHPTVKSCNVQTQEEASEDVCTL